MSSRFRQNDRLVYTTGDREALCPECGEPLDLCSGHDRPPDRVKNDGIVRIRREVKGRKGKTVTTLTGFPLPDQALGELASDLKRFCGTGGSVKDGVIIIQGDHGSKILPWLESRGFKSRIAGG
ncbi:hypothetical protein JW948_07530 [bacterium]|nr:hypothetical protein [bacterium]